MTRPQTVPEGVGECVGPSQAAVMLGVTERTVRRWAEDGTLATAYTTEGGHRRFLLADVDALRAASLEASS